MRIIVVGATGKIGSQISEALEIRHEVVRVSRSGGDMAADYTDPGSVKEMYDRIGSFDGLVVSIGGDSVFKPYDELEDIDFVYGFERKFLGQLRLVRMGVPYAADGASFTLSSGFLSEYPNEWSIATGPLNAAIDSAVHGIAPLLPRGLRLNVVSPAPVVPAGAEGLGKVTAEQAAKAYVGAVEGNFTGQIIRAWGGLGRASGLIEGAT